MHTKPPFSSNCAALLALGTMLLFSATTSRAQNSGTVSQAFETAKQAVSADLQSKVVSVYGLGTPAAIQKWYIIFYDPAVTSHGRAVLVENNQIVKTYEAKGGAIYDAKLTFDPSRITSEGPALASAQGYAAQHNLAYDSVRALLKQKSADKPFRWRIELMSAGKSHGFVYVSALDDSVALYEPADTGATASTKSSPSDDNTGKGLVHDVKKTFLGIGGDLQEFFTGERTVDK
jgi:hypothetical protein